MKGHISACNLLLDQDEIHKGCGIFKYKQPQLSLKGELYSAVFGQQRAICQSPVRYLAHTVDRTVREEVTMSHSTLLNEYNIINE